MYPSFKEARGLSPSLLAFIDEVLVFETAHAPDLEAQVPALKPAESALYPWYAAAVFGALQAGTPKQAGLRTAIREAHSVTATSAARALSNVTLRRWATPYPTPIPDDLRSPQTMTLEHLTASRDTVPAVDWHKLTTEGALGGWALSVMQLHPHEPFTNPPIVYQLAWRTPERRDTALMRLLQQAAKASGWRTIEQPAGQSYALLRAIDRASLWGDSDAVTTHVAKYVRRYPFDTAKKLLPVLTRFADALRDEYLEQEGRARAIRTTQKQKADINRLTAALHVATRSASQLSRAQNHT